MSMIMYLRRASAEDLDRLTAEPSAAEALVFPEDYVDPDAGLVEFDKAWHALHFMLTGQVDGRGHPLGIIADETPFIQTGDIGSFEFSLVSPDRMAAFAAGLAAMDDASIAARFDPEAMVREHIYLADAFADEGDEALAYILQGLPALRKFAADCAAAGDGAIRTLA